MDRANFLRYIDAYCAGDMATVGSYFTSDVIFENFGYRQEGPEVIRFMEQLHLGIKDDMKPITLLFDGDQIAMEADAEVLALVDLPHLPIGAMKAGERIKMRMFAFYKIRDGKIAHVRVSGWPPKPA